MEQSKGLFEMFRRPEPSVFTLIEAIDNEI